MFWFMFSENINTKTCQKEHSSDLPNAGRCPIEGKIRMFHGKFAPAACGAHRSMRRKMSKLKFLSVR